MCLYLIGFYNSCLFAWLTRTKPYLSFSLFLCKLICPILIKYYLWGSDSWVFSLKSKAKNQIHLVCKCEFLWVWWGGYGVIWCCVLYCVWGFSFLCVVVDLKPTASSTEPVHKPEGKWQSESQVLSIDCRWHTPIPNEIRLSHRLTLNLSPTDPCTVLQKIVFLE